MSYSLCGTSVANTGQQPCDLSKGVLRRVYIFNGSIAPSGYVDNLTFFNTLVANSKLPKSDGNKVFPLPEVLEIVDKSDANKEGSLNLGFKTVLLEGKPSYSFKFFGGSDLLKHLRTYNNKNVRILEYDANATFWTTTFNGNAVGYQARLFFSGGKVATGQAVEEGVINCEVSILSVTEYYENSYWIGSTGNNVGNIEPLMDVALTNISHVSNVYKIGMQIQGSSLIGAYNVYDAMGALIAPLTFTAGTGLNYGTPLTITSVAVDASLKALTVTFDSTAYGALAIGTKIQLTPPLPIVLDAANVIETKLIPVILTK